MTLCTRGEEPHSDSPALEQKLVIQFIKEMDPEIKGNYLKE